MPKGPTGNPRGRPKGARNRRTANAIAEAEKDGMLPLDFLLSIMRSDKELDVRMDAAKAAAPYVHARLTATEHSGVNGAALIPPMIQIVCEG